jgi:catechol 2,3-dioxygenase-like lactoylglutathione lyase family enzyme
VDLTRRSLLLLLVSACPAGAQLARPNESGVSQGHIHLMVSDPVEHRKLWVDMLGGEIAQAGSLEMFRLPGIYIIASQASSALEGTDGSTVNHFGFLVPSYAEIKTQLAARGVPLFMDNPNSRQVIAVFPDKIRVEFTEEATVKSPAVFHHLHLSSTDPEKLRDWYVKSFGAVPGTRGTFLAALLPGGEVDFRKVPQKQAATKGRALDHIGFEVHNLEAFCKKLQAEGVEFDVPYREAPQLDGLKIAFILDPEGTRIELTEGLESHKPAQMASRWAWMSQFTDSWTASRDRYRGR